MLPHQWRHPEEAKANGAVSKDEVNNQTSSKNRLARAAVAVRRIVGLRVFCLRGRHSSPRGELMKLYDGLGPNPKVVRMFMAEKGIDMPKVTVDLRTGENRQAAHLKRNPSGQLPTLETDSGPLRFRGHRHLRVSRGEVSAKDS